MKDEFLLDPNPAQRSHLDRMISQAWHFRRMYRQEQIEAEVTETEFNRAVFLREYKDMVKGEYPDRKLNLNIFDAMADLLDKGLVDFRGKWVGFSRGVSITPNAIWLPLLHVIQTSNGTGFSEDESPDYLIIHSVEGHEYWGEPFFCDD